MREYIFSKDDLYAVDMRRFDELKELIHCRDCKYYHADPWGYGNCGHGLCFRRVSNHDFCSWAERIDNDTVD